MRLKQVLAFVNNKGGVAKTTSVQNVAAGIIRKDSAARILCIDMDAQCNLSDQYGWEWQKSQMTESDLKYSLAAALTDEDNGRIPIFKKSDRLYYTPASPEFENIEPILKSLDMPNQELGRVFGREVIDYSGDGVTLIQDFFDYVLIDCAPSLSCLTKNALDAADGVVIPIMLDPLSIKGLVRIFNAIKKINNTINPDLKVKGILPVRANNRTILAKNLQQILIDKYGSMLLKSSVRDCIRIKESQAFNKDIFEYAPDCTAAQDYARVVDELID